MPWEALLGGASGLAAMAIVVGVTFAVAILKTSADAFGRRLDAEIQHMVDSRRILLEGQAKYLELTQRLLQERTQAVDESLRTNREAVYKTLWRTTGRLPQWPPNRELTYGDLAKMSTEFRDWYFNEGGLYFSKSARDAYGAVQELVSRVASGTKAADFVSDSDYSVIRESCSKLRSELTDDLYSRREAAQLVDWGSNPA